MKTLLVLRHAKSSWNDGGLTDHQRPLNERGERDAPRMGNLVRRQRLTPHLIISSDAVRAETTATAVATTSGYAGEIVREHLLYLAAPDDIVVVLRAAPGPEAEIVMVVGHNPGLEALVGQLTRQRHEFPTAALAHINLPIDRWRDLDVSTRGTLVGFWLPKELD